MEGGERERGKEEGREKEGGRKRELLDFNVPSAAQGHLKTKKGGGGGGGERDRDRGRDRDREITALTNKTPTAATLATNNAL